jgi:malonyl-CoA O-methyltransferase
MPTNHTDEFSKRAKSYTKHNVIQKKVVKELIEHISSKPKKVVDLGCGSGAVWDEIGWDVESFLGVDKAINMCDIHPCNEKIELLNQDFESLEFDKFEYSDIIISSSALQWANDLDKLLQNISKKSDEVAFAIFCDGTFKSIYEFTGLKSFLPKSDELLSMLGKYYRFEYQLKEYRLEFEDNISKFRYIKNSGVSGGERKLNFKDTKKLIADYPHDYLEFEVLFVWGKTIL